MITEQHLKTILKTQFGFESFRPGQFEAITTLMEQNRLLCIQPTGYGKSLLYQLPSLLLDGITLVISPLLALMRDQVMQLQTRFHIAAAAINSDQTDEENGQARYQATSGKLKILFVAPEQLENLTQFEFLLNLPVSLLVVDEAHCISMWGHDFRPSYRQIIQLVHAIAKKHPQMKILGLTATANDQTEEDIKLQLAGKTHTVHMQRESMDRPNIHLRVIPVQGVAAKLYTTAKLLSELLGEGLIYCSTRENTELAADYLQQQGINAVAYHAGFDPNTKRQLQQEFSQGKYKVIAATNALGMGIDKANLRFIIHFDVPGSITAYYQEVGRSGRDGLTARGILLFNAADKRIQEYFINSAQPAPEHFETVLQLAKDATSPPRLTDIKRLAGLHPTMVTVIVAELVEQGFLQKVKHMGSQAYLAIDKKEKLNLDRYKNQYQAKTHELNRMLNYGIQTERCRMELLRLALGDQKVQACGHCDVCSSVTVEADDHVENIENINSWLTQKTVRTAPVATNQLSSGVAIFDGKLRTPLFLKFMRDRAKNEGIDPELLLLIQKHLNELAQEQAIGCVITIPSRTWNLRDSFAKEIAQTVKVPVFLNYLSWRSVPEARQGELLNNDQRRYNVDQKMMADLQQIIPSGAILLLDDYIGSGSTLQEAARVLRKESNKKQAIIPFTIASIKWRLGKAGMV